MRLAQSETYYPRYQEPDGTVTAVSFAVQRVSDGYWWDFSAEEFQDANDANSYQALTESNNGRWIKTTGWVVPDENAVYSVQFKVTNPVGTWYVQGDDLYVNAASGLPLATTPPTGAGAGTVLASKIIADVAADLFDSTYARFGATEVLAKAVYLSWLNDGQLMISSLKPDASASKRNLHLVSGAYQAISDDAHSLIRPVRNLGTDGLTPGAVIGVTEYEHFNERNPTWLSATPNAAVQIVLTDERDQEHFWVYPPQPATTGYIEAIEGIVPAAIATIDDVITLKDINEPFLYHYLMYRAYQRSTSAYAKTDSMKHWNIFVTGLGRKDLIEKQISPITARKKEQTNAG